MTQGRGRTFEPPVQLLVAAFTDEDAADKVFNQLKEAKKEKLIHIQDVAVIGSSMVNEGRGFLDIPFDPYEITDIEVTHRKWNFQSECQS
jgi:hypothetical protein